VGELNGWVVAGTRG